MCELSEVLLNHSSGKIYRKFLWKYLINLIFIAYNKECTCDGEKKDGRKGRCSESYFHNSNTQDNDLRNMWINFR